MRALLLLLALAAIACASPRPTIGARIGVQRLSASPTGSHTCFVRAEGTVLCWGENHDGQIGDGSNFNIRTAPVFVRNLSNVISVAAGMKHTCALTSTGTVKCWGSNAEGQLGFGPGSTGATGQATDVPGLSGVTSITAGTAHTCARLATGSVKCWGRNANHQLGDGTNAATQFSPVTVSSLTDAVMVSAGGAHTCAVRAGGTVVCWGANHQAQTGRDGDSDTLVPNTILAPLDGNAVYTSVSAGGEFTCARRGDGAILCWGDNDFGQFGNRTISSQRSRPEQVLARVGSREPVPALLVSAGSQHACALIPAHQGLQCWGRNDSGQTGVTLSPFQNFPTPLTDGPQEIATGNLHTCFIDPGDILRCFGDNSSGQLGNGHSGPPEITRDILLQAGSTAVVSVSAGGSHTCAVQSSNHMGCWGANTFFQVASSGGDRLTFTPSPLSFVPSLSAGGGHTMAVVYVSGTPAGWGDNHSGQAQPDLSPADFPVFSFQGRLVGAVGQTTYQVSAGSQHGCETQVGGTVSCRGDNARGQLGPNVPASTPHFNQNVAGFTDVLHVSSGNSHNCALRANGRVACWGLNSFGQLGDNTINDSATPRDPGLTNAVAVSVGANHSCALLADGRIACWGRNDFGQIDGTTSPSRRTPTIVPFIPAGDAVAVAPGFQHTCYLRANGNVQCWGRNQQGQLGNASNANSLTPTNVQVPTFFLDGIPRNFVALPGVVSLESGLSHTCAVLASGNLFCWGDNGSGQIGNGTRIDAFYATFVL